MAEKVYLIHVVARGITADQFSQAEDLLDAAVKAREFQDAGVRRIEILLTRAGDCPDYPYYA